MKQKQNEIDELLVKYLLGEASPAEGLQVAQWLAASEGNRHYYEQFRTIWEKSKSLGPVSTVTEDDAWSRFQQRMLIEAPAPKKTVVRPFRPAMQWMRAAAMLMLLAGAGWLVFYLAGDSGTVTLASNNEVRIDTLPDGSVVTLNKHSTLKYAGDFNGDTRAVTLEGEGFFSVTPDKARPFIIDANGVDVRVVGTSFNVRSSGDSTEVIVETGRVEVARQQTTVSLRAAERAVVVKDRAPVKMPVTDSLYNYYRTREFICNGTPLWRLANILETVYDVRIFIPDGRLREERLTATFRNEPVEHILTVVAETFGATVEHDGEHYVLKYRE